MDYGEAFMKNQTLAARDLIDGFSAQIHEVLTHRNNVKLSFEIDKTAHDLFEYLATNYEETLFPLLEKHDLILRLNPDSLIVENKTLREAGGYDDSTPAVKLKFDLIYLSIENPDIKELWVAYYDFAKDLGVKRIIA